MHCVKGVLLLHSNLYFDVSTGSRPQHPGVYSQACPVCIIYYELLDQRLSMQFPLPHTSPAAIAIPADTDNMHSLVSMA